MPEPSNGKHKPKNNKTMPLAQIKGISGLLNQSQKQELISKITDAIVSVEGEGLRPVTWVILEEVNSGSWGVGGKALTTDDVRALAAPAACSACNC
jgi:4-oxalocrotonate tautomerase